MKSTITLLAGLWMSLAGAHNHSFNQDDPAAPISIGSVSGTTIGEDLKITETTLEAARPLMPGKSLAEVVTDEMKIVESPADKKRPLDFAKINRKKPAKSVFTIKNKRLIGSL